MQGSELEIIEVWDDVIVVEVSDVVIEVAVTEDVIEVVVGEGALATAWGSITGTLGNQRDLQAALDEKADADDLGDLALKDAADWDDDIVNKPSSFPPAAHDHDDRYYTEAEVDTALNLKAPKASPTFTGKPKAPTAAASTNNTQIATTAFVQNGLAGKSDTGHTHDDRYYTEGETDAALAGKSDVTHDHDGVYLPLHGTADLSGGVVPITLTDENLNDLRPENTTWYNALENTVTNKPAGVNAFILCAYRSGSTPRIQVLTQPNGTMWSRKYQNGWSEWVKWNVNYQLPTASASVLGGVMVGRNLSMDAAGVLSADASGIVGEVSGNPAAFSDGAPVPVVELTAGIMPVQSGSGDPAPDNIRRITGRTGVNIVMTGKNLCPKFDSRTIAGVTFTVNDDGTIAMSGTADGNANVFVNGSTTSSGSNFIIPNGNYIASGGVDNNIYLVIKDGSTRYDIKSPNDVPITVTNGKLNIYGVVLSGTDTTNKVLKPMIRLASVTDNTYEAFGTNYAVSLSSAAGTVYGGSLDVTAGILTVTHGFIEMQDLLTFTGAPNWRKSGNALNGFFIYSAYITPVMKINTYAISSHFKTVTDTAEYYNTYGTMILEATVNFNCDPTVCGSTGADFQQWLEDQKTAGTPVELWYELKTPVTYQLDPMELSTILGQNTISADTGPVTLRYRADTKLYIDGKFAELQALILEN